MTLFRTLWSPVEVRRELAHPVEVVFAVLADPHTYPTWLVGAQRMRSVDDDFPAPGSEFHHSVGVAEATVDDRSEVIAVAAPHRLEMQVEVGPIHGVVELLVDDAAGGSSVRFRERPAGLAAILTPLTRPVLAARNTESLRRLDELLGQMAAGPESDPDR
jgi:uncharacterized protein YndB with AHSA1/START domain